MGHVHHPGIKERGIAPLQLPSYQRPGGLDASSLAATPFRGNGSQRPLEPGVLDSIEAVHAFPRTMACSDMHPVVDLVTTTYQTGVKLIKEAMDRVEAQFPRLPHLEKWFVDITYLPSTFWDT